MHRRQWLRFRRGRRQSQFHGLANGCDRKVACRIDAYVTGARGPASGHITLSFPPKAQSPATMSYVLRVKSAGGTAQYSKRCRFL
jgi:hypothetical protein